MPGVLKVLKPGIEERLAEDLAAWPELGHHLEARGRALGLADVGWIETLERVRDLMLAEPLDAATVALRVGYESPTQFSREYRRMFGHPPVRDIKVILKSDDSTRRGSVG